MWRGQADSHDNTEAETTALNYVVRKGKVQDNFNVSSQTYWR